MWAMAKKSAAVSPLVEVATALEAALDKYAAIVHEADTLEINSEKTIHRAKALLEACVASEQQMAERLHAFAGAMRDIQKRQEDCAKRTVEAAKKIEIRVQGRAALLERFAALGASTRDVDGPVKEVMTKRAEGAPAQDLLPALAEVVARTDTTLESASAVAKDAEELEWHDIAREAHALKQQLADVRNKILLAQRDLAVRSPS
jgi:hypothetical protein